MAQLVGSVSTFEGDPDENVLVTVPGIIQGSAEYDPDIGPFLQNVAGNSCPGFLSTKGDIILDSLNATREILDSPLFVPPCTWVRRFAPLIFSSDFSTGASTVDFDSGEWMLSATFLFQRRLRTHANPDDDCWEESKIPKTFLYTGPRPVIISPHLNTRFCNYTLGVSAFSSESGLISLSYPPGPYFENNTGRIVLVLPNTTNGPSNPLQGGIFMPIPDIPAGYPPPPQNNGSYTGQISESQISDDDCFQIVYRGQGFQTLWDIGNRGEVAEQDEHQWFQTKTYIFGMNNVELAPDIVNVMTDEVLEYTSLLVIGRVLDKVVESGSVVIKSGGLNKILTFLGPLGKIVQTVEIASELIQDVVMLLGQLFVPQCLDSNPPDERGLLRLVPIPFPVQTVDGQSTLAGMQAICDALYALLRCCPPCAQDGWREGPTMDTEYIWSPGFVVTQVLFQTVEVKEPAHVAMGGQMKLGWFKWRVQDDENHDTIECQEPIWINHNEAVFFAKNGMVTGFRFMPQNGVTLKVLFRGESTDMQLNRLTGPPPP
ncbi:MAG: hypothetical protein ABJA67_05550 [Chthonomonadales bacterium]